MKKLILKTLLLTVISITILTFILDPIFREVSANSKTFNDFYNNGYSDSLDILVIGSSHAKNTYAPMVIDSVFNTRTYNLGTGGQNYISTNVLLESVLKKTKPKLVVVDLFPALMRIPVQKKPKGSQLGVYDYTPLSIKKLEAINTIYSFNELPSVFSPTLRYHDKWYDRNWKQESFIPNQNLTFSNGYYNSNKQMNKADQTKYKNFREKHAEFLVQNKLSKLDTLRFELIQKQLNETIKICEKFDLELIFVSAPYFPSFYRKGLNNTHLALKKFFEERGIIFIDYNIRFLEMGLTTDDFWNQGHLNIKGSRKVSTEFVQDISKLGIFEVKDKNYLEEQISYSTPKTKEEIKVILNKRQIKLIEEISSNGNQIVSSHKFNEDFQIKSVNFFMNSNKRYIVFEANQSIENSILDKYYFLFIKTVNKADFDKRPKWQLGTDKNKMFWEASAQQIIIKDKSYLLFSLDTKVEITKFDEIRAVLRDQETGKNVSGAKPLILKNVSVIK